MQAITTKYFGPGNVRGTRVKATAQAGTISVAWDHALNYERNHAAAAKAFAIKMGWHGQWVGGGMPNGGMCWIAADSPDCFSTFTSQTPKEQTR